MPAQAGVDAMSGATPPVRFVCPARVVWPELPVAPPVPEIGPQRLSDLSDGIVDCWLLRTYYHLARAGLSVSVGEALDPAAINIVAPRDFGRRQARGDAFTVVARGDAHLCMLADFVIEQNGQRGPGPLRLSIPHWPQPGILPRDPARGERVERLVYKGRRYNLSEAFRSQDFADRLGELGVELEIDGFDTLRGEHRWNDYRSADLVLAARNLTRYDACRKPASKLVNAWLAHVPPLLGPEPPFAELRRSPHDYMEIRTPDDVIAAVRRLRETPGLHAAMTAQARLRAAEYREAEMTRRWVEALSGPIAAAFRRWRRRPLGLRRAQRLAGVALEWPSKRIHGFRVGHGPRILDAPSPG
jgi:hypothetical protein